MAYLSPIWGWKLGKLGVFRPVFASPILIPLSEEYTHHHCITLYHILHTFSTYPLVLVVQEFSIEIEKRILFLLWFLITLKQKSWILSIMDALTILYNVVHIYVMCYVSEYKNVKAIWITLRKSKCDEAVNVDEILQAVKVFHHFRKSFLQGLLGIFFPREKKTRY